MYQLYRLSINMNQKQTYYPNRNFVEEINMHKYAT